MFVDRFRSRMSRQSSVPIRTSQAFRTGLAAIRQVVNRQTTETRADSDNVSALGDKTNSSHQGANCRMNRVKGNTYALGNGAAEH